MPVHTNSTVHVAHTSLPSWLNAVADTQAVTGPKVASPEGQQSSRGRPTSSHHLKIVVDVGIFARHKRSS